MDGIEQSTIGNLQGRLARRNDLLDIIRKAYHRDVLSIKQYLLEAEKEGLLVNKTALSSLPSIDLKEGFPLFAPHECELRVRPCETCGGQLEIIHRESSRIVQYKHAIQQMEENEIDLRIEVIDAKSQAKRDRDRLVEEMQRSQNERDVLGNQIEHLKSQLSNCNAEIERLHEDKAHLERTLEKQQPIISDHQRIVVELQKEREESRRLEANFIEQKEKAEEFQQKHSAAVEELQNQTSRNQQLQMDLQQERLRCNMFEDLTSKLKKELFESQSIEKEHVACLQQAQGTIDELKSILAHDRDKMSSEIQDLTETSKRLTAQVSELDELSRCKSSEADYYRLRIKCIVEEARDRGSIPLVPNTVEDQLSTVAELIRDHETLRQETKAISKLLTSCIRTVYESCIVQEKMLRDNDSGLHRNVQIQVLTDTPNEAWQLVMRNLDTAKAETIDWQSIIKNDEDRSSVLSSLHNRQQIGQFSLDKAFEKERKRHDRILSKCQYEHEKETTELRRTINELERQFTESTTLIRKYEQKMIKLQQKHALGVVPLLTSAQDLLLQVRKEVQQEEENTFNKLREDFFHLRGVTINLLDTLRVSREKIAHLNTTLLSRDDDVSARDAAIVHFEEMLTKITHKYAENERKRASKEMVEKSVQASVKVKEASTFDDFLRLPLDKRSQENNPSQQHDHALLPGRIFQIRENIGKIQFRRALDKL